MTTFNIISASLIVLSFILIFALYLETKLIHKRIDYVMDEINDMWDKNKSIQNQIMHSFNMINGIVNTMPFISDSTKGFINRDYADKMAGIKREVWDKDPEDGKWFNFNLSNEQIEDILNKANNILKDNDDNKHILQMPLINDEQLKELIKKS